MIRLLCAGLGGMGRHDWSSAAKVKAFKIVGGADVNDAARTAFEKETGAPAFADFGEALKRIEADAALVATPDAFHAPMSIAAMKAGLDVICEKPMAATLADARMMHRTARRLGRLLMIHHQLNWLPSYFHARRMLARGAIGRLRSALFDMSVFSNACLVGYRSKLPHLMLKDLAIHHFDLIRHLTGAECERISARDWASNEDGAGIKATSHAFAVLDMSGPITVSYRSTMRCIADPTGYGCRVELTGSKGVMTVNSEAITIQTFKRYLAKQPPQTVPLPKCDGTPWPDFARAIMTRKPALTDSADNLRSVELLYAAIASAESGKTVNLRRAASG